MIQARFIAVITLTWACFAAPSLNAATVPAGTTLAIRTVSMITSKDTEGRAFEATLERNVVVNGNVLVRAGSKVLGRVKSSRARSGRDEPFSVELTSISVNGHKIAVRTNSVEPMGASTTQLQARHGVTVGTTVVQPGSKMEFQLARAVTL
jgi:hypothetical protein